MAFDWSTLAGSAIQAGVDVGMGIYNNRYNAKQQRASEARQREYQIENALYGPSLQRKGLEMAGYNPMLALDSVNPMSHVPAASQMASAISSNSDHASLFRDMFRDLWSLEKRQREANIEESQSRKHLNDAQRIQGGFRTGADIIGQVVDTVGDLSDPTIVYSPGNKPKPNAPKPNAPKPNAPKPNAPKPNAPKPKYTKKTNLPDWSPYLLLGSRRLLPILTGSLIPSHEGGYERRLMEIRADRTLGKSRAVRGVGEKIRRRRRVKKGIDLAYPGFPYP